MNGRSVLEESIPTTINPSSKKEIKVQKYLPASNLPRECKHRLPRIQHPHLGHLPELIQTTSHIHINTKDIVRYIFVFPAHTITNSNSTFHPKGMQHYYFLCYYYNKEKKRYVSSTLNVSLFLITTTTHHPILCAKFTSHQH